jgi:hypothetical protein
MASKEQTKNQIKFALNQLGTKNAHHEFEHLCRHLTKARICSNVLPATGPVSAGGDAGADFESFRSNVAEDFGNGSFVSIVSEKRVAFSCSIQVANLEGKIKGDIEKNSLRAIPPERVVYFSNQQLPVAKRQSLQEWALSKKNIELEVFDPEAISELLADVDTYWIAIEYLHLPPELMPPPNEPGESWYQRFQEKYKGKDQSLSLNFSEFFEIKRATRKATFDSKRKGDLSFWIGLLSKYASEFQGKRLGFLANYEIAVASLRGRDDGATFLQCIKMLFGSFSKTSDIDELESLQTLYFYIIGGSRQGLVAIDDLEILGFRAQLIAKLDAELKADPPTTIRLRLLEIRGAMEMLDENLKHDFSLEKTLHYWNQMLSHLDNCPLLPAENLNNRVLQVMELYGSSVEVDKFADAVGKIVASRTGKSAAAELNRNRAIIYYNQKKILRALDLLHEAKINWFQQETIVGSILSIILIAEWYLELGLCYAAKYYAMAAFKMAFRNSDESTKKYLPRIALTLTSVEYLGGNWISFLERTEFYLRVYAMYENEPGKNIFVDTSSSSLAAHAAIMRAIVKKVRPDLDPIIKKRLTDLGHDDFFNEASELASKAWDHLGIPEVKARAEEDLTDVPLADTGKIRKITWEQVGVRFEVSFENTFERAVAAETLSALLQAIIADCHQHDLKFVPGSIQIDLRLIEPTLKLSAEEVPSNEVAAWLVLWPNRDVQADNEMLALLFQIIMGQSLCTDQQLWSVFEDRMKAGLVNKLWVLDSYDSLLRNISVPSEYASQDRLASSPLFIPETFHHNVHEEIAWDDSVDTTYNREQSLSAVKRRYLKTPPVIKYTLKKVCLDPQIRQHIEALKEEGWLDWQILGAIASVTLNHRLNLIPDIARKSPSEIRALMSRAYDSEESSSDPEPPLNLFSLQLLRDSMKMNLITTAMSLGLVYRAKTPNLDGVLRFMKSRFNICTDDVSHEDFFGESES